jgi:hypothetical protein
MRTVIILFIAVCLGGFLGGCAKTIKTSIKVGTCALEVPLAVYEDATDNVGTVIKELKHPVPPPEK